MSESGWMNSLRDARVWARWLRLAAREARHGAKWFAYRAGRIRIFDGAASLSYASIVSLVAILLCVASVFTSFLDSETVITRIENLIYPVQEQETSDNDTWSANRTEPDSDTSITAVESAEAPSTWLRSVTDEVLDYETTSLTTIGLAMLVVTGSSLIAALEGILNTIWFVRRARPIVMRIVVYWGAVSISPMLLILATMLETRMQSLPVLGPLVSTLPVGLSTMTTIVLTVAALTWTYKVLPNTFVPIWAALAGGLSAGALWFLAKHLFTLYVVHYAGGLPFYALLGGLPLFLVWIYVAWLVVLTGALITYGVQHRRVLPWTPGGASRECIWVDEIIYRVMYVIGHDFHNHLRAPDIDDIVNRVQAEEEVVRTIIERLLKDGTLDWTVDENQKERGLRPGRSLDQMRLADVIAATSDPKTTAPWAEATDFAQAIESLRTRRRGAPEANTVRSLLP